MQKTYGLPAFPALININMRCIEIMPRMWERNLGSGININMRCIEMQIRDAWIEIWSEININMRCIEIFMRATEAAPESRLI